MSYLVLCHISWQVFIKEGSLYAFKGLSGRLGPIGVHAALILILGGTWYSGFGGAKGSVMTPEGQDFVIVDYMRPASPISSLPAAASSTIHVDDFTIDYRPDGSVAQFYSTLSLIDPQVSTSLTQLLKDRISRDYGRLSRILTRK
jgi:cytochrome c biogenesis protein